MVDSIDDLVAKLLFVIDQNTQSELLSKCAVARLFLFLNEDETHDDFSYLCERLKNLQLFKNANQDYSMTAAPPVINDLEKDIREFGQKVFGLVFDRERPITPYVSITGCSDVICKLAASAGYPREEFKILLDDMETYYAELYAALLTPLPPEKKD